MATWRNKRDSAENWTNNNPVLGPGVIGVIEENGHFKMGNGVSHWDGLPTYLPDTDIEALIEEYVNSLPSGEVTNQDLLDHVNDPTPHPAYDEGIDLVTFYENVKAG